MASNIVNINNTDNNITVTNANQKVIVTDNNTDTSVNVTNPNTSIVQVNTLGPQGSIGAQGSPGSGSAINTSSFATTGSNTFIGNQIISSSSTLFSSSLLITNPNDTQYGIGLNNRSFTPTVASQGPHLGIWVQNNGQAFLGTEYGQTLNIYSNTTNQYSNSAIKVTGSNALITGSLFGTSSWAYNVVNGGNINISSFATTGSNTFKGNQIILGSVTADNLWNRYTLTNLPLNTAGTYIIVPVTPGYKFVQAYFHFGGTDFPLNTQIENNSDSSITISNPIKLGTPSNDSAIWKFDAGSLEANELYNKWDTIGSNVMINISTDPIIVTVDGFNDDTGVVDVTVTGYLKKIN